MTTLILLILLILLLAFIMSTIHTKLVTRRCDPTKYKFINTYHCPHCKGEYPDNIALDIIQKHEKYICNKCGEISSTFVLKTKQVKI